MLSDGFIPLERLYKDPIQTGIEEGGEKMSLISKLLDWIYYKLWKREHEAERKAEREEWWRRTRPLECHRKEEHPKAWLESWRRTKN